MPARHHTSRIRLVEVAAMLACGTSMPVAGRRTATSSHGTAAIAVIAVPAAARRCAANARRQVHGHLGSGRVRSF
jgi:hypothetical protein